MPGAHPKSAPQLFTPDPWLRISSLMAADPSEHPLRRPSGRSCVGTLERVLNGARDLLLGRGFS